MAEGRRLTRIAQQGGNTGTLRQEAARLRPYSLAKGRTAGADTTACFCRTTHRDRRMTDRQQIYDNITAQIAPFNKKEVALTEATTFAGDLEWDSLTVMDFVAAIEDEFDIIITMNMQAEIETVGQLADAVAKLKA
jgi:acyl carrier protein